MTCQREWASYVCRYAKLGDARLKTRMVLILQALSAQPNASLPEAFGSPQQMAAYYTFVNNARVTPDRLLAVASEDTGARIRALPVVLAIQDGTDYNYTHHPGTKGQGPLKNPHSTGFNVHTTLAVSPEGVPLGLLHQQLWVRDPETVGKRTQRRQLEIEEKESYHWLESLTATENVVPAGTTVVTIADREADIYELFGQPRPATSHLLIRTYRDRRVTVPEMPTLRYLHEALEDAPELGGRYVEVRRAPHRPARQAKVLIQRITVQIHPPGHGKHKNHGKLPLTYLVVREIDPPAGVEPIHWVLATTWPVADLATACQLVYWYSLRWLVERYHYTLKSGCRLEELQLRSVPALERALLLYALVAWRLLWLTYLGRHAPDRSCEVALTPTEWQTLHVATESTPVPTQPPALQTVIQQLARLGGHRGYPSAGPPGVKVLWRGWATLQTLVTFVRRGQVLAARAAVKPARKRSASPPGMLNEPALKRAA